MELRVSRNVFQESLQESLGRFETRLIQLEISIRVCSTSNQKVHRFRCEKNDKMFALGKVIISSPTIMLVRVIEAFVTHLFIRRVTSRNIAARPSIRASWSHAMAMRDVRGSG